jgi:hypothetical protein
LVEQGFGWQKCVGVLRKLHHRGRETVSWLFAFSRAAYNRVRMRSLLPRAQHDVGGGRSGECRRECRGAQRPAPPPMTAAPPRLLTENAHQHGHPTTESSFFSDLLEHRDTLYGFGAGHVEQRKIRVS